MAETPDHYQLLGVSKTATADEIKRAFREHAKRAHPDAGGSVEAMQHLNEAYKVLSDPPSRRDYDQRFHAPASSAGAAYSTTNTSSSTAGSSPHSGYASPADHPSHGQSRAPGHQSSHSRSTHPHHQLRLSQARASAWHILKSSAPMALMLGLIARFVTSQTPDLATKLLLSGLAFIPYYGVFLGLIFWVNPDLRLAVFDLLHSRASRRLVSQAERRSLLALGLCALPLAVIWFVFIGL
jgi:curved DNA-binding protein CbpA